MIAVVDYCKGNLRSVERGLIDAGGDARITDDPREIRAADAIVLPGVGAFADASNTMQATGQMSAIEEAIAVGTPFLGICLGEHLLFEAGAEGARACCSADAGHDAEGVERNAGDACRAERDGASANGAYGAGTQQGIPKGLGVLPGVVGRMPECGTDGTRYKVPHVGWNSIEFSAGTACPLLRGIAPGEYFYFTHSYIAPDCEDAIATTTHSVTFPCVVQKGDTVFGVQFHPEKSSDAGARVLKNFVDLVREQSAAAHSCGERSGDACS